MKKMTIVTVVVVALVAAVLLGCKFIRGQVVDGPGMERDSTEVKAMDEISGKIHELYAAAAQNAPDIDFRFACHTWRDMVAAVEKQDANDPEVDDIGFFNDDYWTMMQDDNPEDLEARNISFVELDVEKGTALVDYELWSSVQTIHQRFRFCHEDGEWRVHDIIRYYRDADGKETAHSLMEAMQAYLK
jgi:PAS domain-containing protein